MRARYEKAWIEHGDIVNIGELILEMGAKPSVDWGTKTAPPSKIGCWSIIKSNFKINRHYNEFQFIK